MKQNDHIPKDNALRQALRQRAERCTAENPVPADLEGLVMQRILRSKQQPATRRRSLLRLLPWSIAAALLVGFTLMKALYQLPHEGEKTLSTLPREGESLATLESSQQGGGLPSLTGGVGGGSAGSPEESSPIPPDKQALADIYLAEVALQVAYRKQAAEEAVRAYQAGITGEETQQPIIAF